MKEYRSRVILSRLGVVNSGKVRQIGEVSIIGDDDTRSLAWIAGHSCRTGKVLSGIIGLSCTDMDKLAIGWLESRGIL